MRMINIKSGKLGNPHMVVEEITPTIAAEYLGRNENNRRVKVKHVSNLARAMKIGEWQLNGDAIRFDTDGVVVDGQHRLLAIIESGVTIKTVVMRGLDPETFHTIDTNKVRGGSDVLSIEGVKANPMVLAGAVRLVWISNLLDETWDGSVNINVKMTNNDILKIHREFPGIEESVIATSLGSRRACRKLMTPSACAFIHFWLSSIDPDDTELFFDWVEFTENISRSHPANLLKNKLSDLVLTGARDAKRKRVTLALVFRAWNAVRDGEPMKSLRWSPTTSFPIPR